MRPAKRRELVEWLSSRFDVSIRRSCRLVGLSRATYDYQSRKKSHTALRMRLRELAATRRRFGYRRLWVLLRREGFKVNHKLVYRRYPPVPG